MKRLKMCVMLLLLMCLLRACIQEPQLNEQQLMCEHDWVEVDWSYWPGNNYVIYCPKCKLEKAVDYKTLNIIQIDAEYKAELEGE